MAWVHNPGVATWDGETGRWYEERWNSQEKADALLRSLVYDGGVRQQDITVCEPSRWLTDALYLKCKGEFPKVNYVDNVGLEGRTKAEYYDNAIPASSPDRPPTDLFLPSSRWHRHLRT